MVTLMPARETDVYSVVSYQVSTSSMLSHEELLTLALLARSKYGCSEHGLEVTLDYFKTRAQQERALDILQFKLDILWSMLDAIEKAFPA